MPPAKQNKPLAAADLVKSMRSLNARTKSLNARTKIRPLSARRSKKINDLLALQAVSGAVYEARLF